jgi:transcriptional regulator with XRE-family HTH domain
MDIARRIRELRELKELSQGDIEVRTGLLRCYISRVENGHTVPALETLQKIARALETPLYQLFYEGEEPPRLDTSPRKNGDWASQGKGYRILRKFRQALAGMTESQRKVLLSFAGELARTKHKEKSSSALVGAPAPDAKRNRDVSWGG